MEEFLKLINDVCDEMERLRPDWEYCPICSPIILYLRSDKKIMAVNPLKSRIRTLMREMKSISLERYNNYNSRFRSLKV